MKKSHRPLVISITLAASLTFAAFVKRSSAGEGTAPPRDLISLGESDVKQLVILLDQDKNGKVSEQEFMSFMQAEFKRLDRDNSGELDVKELKRSQLKSSRTFLSGGK